MNSSLKRKRTRESSEAELDNNSLQTLPDAALLQAIIDQYFQKVHHWIPILHQRSFRAKVMESDGQSKLNVLLHAIVSASIKYVIVEEYGITEEEMHCRIRMSRNVVLLEAMEIPSVENLQALAILAFDFVCHLTFVFYIC
jgi:hypothetical protein